MQVRSVVGCFQDKRYSTSQAEIDPCPYPPHSTLEYTSLELTGALRSFNNEIDVSKMTEGLMQQIGGNAACLESADAEPAGGQTATAVDLVVDVDQPVTAGAAVANAVGGEPSDDNIAKWKNRNRGASLRTDITTNSGRGVSAAPPFFKKPSVQIALGNPSRKPGTR